MCDSMMTKCCYKPKELEGSRFEECPHVIEPLETIAGKTFCRLHIPWSPTFLFERFGVAIADDDPSRALLKDKWNEAAKEKFVHDSKRYLANGEDMTGVTFIGDLEISGLRQVLTADAVFVNRLTISGSVGRADFRNAIFCRAASFRGPINNEINLSGAKFLEEADFDNCTLACATFNRCSFRGNVNFCQGQIREFAKFNYCEFFEIVSFRDCRFDSAEWLSFDFSHFFGPAIFLGFKNWEVHRASFKGAIFERDAIFEGRRFTTALNFADANFYRAPQFQDVSFPFRCIFPKVDGFLDWRVIPKEFRLGAQGARMEYYRGASQSYRTLRHAMKLQEAHEEEATFWELEMRAKERSLDWGYSGWLPKLISKLYGWSSRYGNSVGRPLVCWVVLWLGFALLYASYENGLGALDVSALIRIGDFSFRQTVRPLGVWAPEGGSVIERLVFGGNSLISESQMLTIKLVTVLQSVLSLACIALFGFALRRRFRMA